MASTTTIPFRPKTLNLDVPPSETGPDEYNWGTNCQFELGHAKKSMGWQKIFPDPGAGDPQYLLNVLDEGNSYWVVACSDRILVTDTESYFDITPTDGSWAAPVGYNQWTGGVLNGRVVLNAGQSSPWYWSGNTGAPMEALPGWTAGVTCGAIRPFKYHLIALNITTALGNFPDQVTWSSAAPPGGIPQEWLPSSTNTAGDLQLSATPVPIIDGAALRDQFVVYKQHSTYILDYVGGTFVFSARKVFASSGILSKNCVAEYESNHYVLTDGDVIRHDGQTMESLFRGRARNAIFDSISSENFSRSYVALNTKDNEVMFCFPVDPLPDPTVAICYDVRTGSIGLRDFTETRNMAWGNVTVADDVTDWDSATTSWNNAVGVWNAARYNAAEDGVLMAQSNWVYYLDASVDADGVETTFSVAKEQYDFGTPAQNKTVVRVWPKVDKATTADLSFRMGATDSPNETIPYGPTYSFDPQVEDYIDAIISGRYISFQWTSSGGELGFIGFDVELNNSSSRY